MRTNIYTSKIIFAAILAAIFVSCDREDMGLRDENTPEKAPGYSFAISGGRGGSGSGDENSGTRAYLNPGDGQYYWDVGDQVGLIFGPQGAASYSSLIAYNLMMTGTNSSRVLHTDFTGTVSQTQYDALAAGTTFDYYSYYPYNTTANIGTNFPNIQFSIPSTLNLTPGVFNPNYAPMVADKVTGSHPIVFIDGQGTQSGDQICFDYKHVLSYAAIEMDVNLLGAPVSSITMSSSGAALNGTYTYNMSTGAGAAGYSGGSNSLTINITGGLSVGSGNVLYIPMVPGSAMSGQTFTFTFNTPTSTSNVYRSVTVPGMAFERGKIHKLRIAPVAQYTASSTFTVTKDGYYYVEAWGGDGGAGGTGVGNNSSAGVGGTKGTSTRQGGIYYFYAGDILYVQVGAAGSDGTGNTDSRGGSKEGGGTAGGGATGTWFGSGYAGGNGGNGGNLWVGGGGGGGGGSASGVLKNGTATANIVIASGGAGAGAGGGVTIKGGNGGASNTAGTSGSISGGTNWSTTSTNGYEYGGGQRHNGGNGSTAQRGGGGGWNGAAGGGGQSGIGGAAGAGNGGGGGGAGGGSSSGTQAANPPAYTAPTNSRLNSPNGFVVITLIKRAS